MNKQTLIWTLIIAVPVALAALATAYVYRESGHLPFQKPAETVSAPSDQSTETGTQAGAGSQEKPTETLSSGETKVAETEPKPGEEVNETVKGPSFDVVGVEPTGETVVAGRSDAGAIVALTANGKVIGKSIANEVGEWTIILDEPLKPGDYDVGLEVHDQQGEAIGESDQRLAVSVPEGGKEQPLVVLNSTDGPSDILQKPATEQAVAQVDEKPASSETQAAATDGSSTQPSGEGKETVVAAVPDNTSGTETAPAATAAPTETGEDNSATDVAGTPAISSEETAPATAPTETVAAPATSEDTQSKPTTATETADAPSQQPAQESEVAAVPGGSDQSETATTGEGTVTASASEDAPAKPTETAAAVPEAKPEGSEAGTPVATAPTDGQSDQPSATTEVATAPASQAEQPADLPVPAPTVTVEAVESEKDKVFVAGTGEPGSSVRVYVDDDFQGEAEVNASGKWLLEGDKNVPEGNVEVRADLVGDDGNKVDARAAVTFEKEAEQQIVLTKVVATGTGGGAENEGAAVQKALPRVIIRKGDNLWRISRRLYGDGVRYTTIYQANQDQIRNPDLIYPGQVFLTPEGDLNWPKPKEDG
ncbi:LysM peptidoglycan-binding domain-containing protein [Roseibium sp.]|uniref:LysM peptidoglycan-binding domain-containing protein n=1 Tax=Roseibium sp. TaxID=1936156 RepID=UPI0039F0F006